MNYYFPSFINSIEATGYSLSQLKYTVNSGTNAIRLLLRSFNLPLNSKVAIPAFVCKSVKEAAESEKLISVLFDMKADNTFWTHYDFVRLKEENIKVVILVHLYGFLHPDTKTITDFCEENNILLLHDAAQSYGIDEKMLRGAGVIYSFGAGKSTTAACGGWITSVNEEKTSLSIHKPSLFSFQNIRAKLFLKSRIFGYEFSGQDDFLKKLLIVIPNNARKIVSMSKFQKQMSMRSIVELKNILPLRKIRYTILKDKVGRNSQIGIAYDDEVGLYFKMVLYVKDNMAKLKNYLRQNQIPYFALFENTPDASLENQSLANFLDKAERFIEISTEASIPENEIIRISKILNSYK